MVESDGVPRAPGSRMLQQARRLQAEMKMQQLQLDPRISITQLTESKKKIDALHPLALPQLYKPTGSSLLSSQRGVYKYLATHDEHVHVAKQLPAELPGSFDQLQQATMFFPAIQRSIMKGPQKGSLVLESGARPDTSNSLDHGPLRPVLDSVFGLKTSKVSLISSKVRAVVVRTAGGAAIAGIGDLVSALFRYATNMLLTHIVSQGAYGVFVETFMVVTVVGELAKCGLDATILHFLPTYQTKNQQRLALGLLYFVIGATLVVGLTAAALCFFGADSLSTAVFRRTVYSLPLRELTPLVPLLALQMLFASTLQALGAIKWKVYVDRLLQPIVTFGLLLVLYLLGLRSGALILALTGGFLVSVLVGAFFVRRVVAPLARMTTPLFATGTWLRFGFPVLGSSLIRTSLNSLDVLLLGVFVSPELVGIYGAADRMSWLVGMPLFALNVIFTPMIATYYAQGREQALGELFKLVTRWIISLSLPLFICMLLFGQSLLGLFGNSYRSAYILLIILSLGNFADAAAGPVQYVLAMTGRTVWLFVNTLLALAVNIGLECWLVPLLQGTGAAIATAATVGVLNLTGLLEVGLLLGKHPYRLNLYKPVLAGCVSVLPGLVLRQLALSLPERLVLLQVLLEVVPVLLVYGTVLFLLGVSQEDRQVWQYVIAKFGYRR